MPRKTPAPSPLSPPTGTDPLAPRPQGADLDMSGIVGSGLMDGLARDAAEIAGQAMARNTRDAYRSDWKLFTDWCARTAQLPEPPSPALLIGYMTMLARPVDPGTAPLSVSTIERRLTGILAMSRLRGYAVDRSDPALRVFLAGLRRSHGRPPRPKAAFRPHEISAVLDACGLDLRGLRDRAMLMIGLAGGLRRSEIVGLDRSEADRAGGTGWIAEIVAGGMLLVLRGKTGWREVEIARCDGLCPVASVEAWLVAAGIATGPVFRAFDKSRRRVTGDRLTAEMVAHAVKSAVRRSRIREDEMPLKDRVAAFAGHSLRATAATLSPADERFVQRQLGHRDLNQTRAYRQRGERYAVNMMQGVFNPPERPAPPPASGKGGPIPAHASRPEDEPGGP